MLYTCTTILSSQIVCRSQFTEVNSELTGSLWRAFALAQLEKMRLSVPIKTQTNHILLMRWK